MQSFTEATRDYQTWLADVCAVRPADFAAKDEKMRKKGAVGFLRGTFYRWMQRWPGDAGAPVVPSIGDLHLENFGTWRDAEGRLCWGVNDYDEAFDLPYTQDLVRLMTSVRLAIKGSKDSSGLPIDKDTAAEQILGGYQRCVQHDGRPIVLSSFKNDWLKELAQRGDDPPKYWRDLEENIREGGRIDALPAAWRGGLTLLEARLPEPGLAYRAALIRRGTGSLGRVRFGGIARWRGESVGREVKALAPSAALWAQRSADRTVHFERVMRGSRQAPDPSIHLDGQWFARAMGPDAQKINLEAVNGSRDLAQLTAAMGQAAANVHLGGGARDAIATHLAQQPRRWLLEASREMAERVEEDWKAWR